MIVLVLYTLLTTALYYLAARALITRWLWSRYPPFLDRMALCAACAGFWIGLVVGAVGAWGGVLVADLPWHQVPLVGIWASVPVVGLCAMVWTPLGYQAMERALSATGAASAVEDGSS